MKENAELYALKLDPVEVFKKPPSRANLNIKEIDFGHKKKTHQPITTTAEAKEKEQKPKGRISIKRTITPSAISNDS